MEGTGGQNEFNVHTREALLAAANEGEESRSCLIVKHISAFLLSLRRQTVVLLNLHSS
jgi:hypothetical protein